VNNNYNMNISNNNINTSYNEQNLNIQNSSMVYNHDNVVNIQNISDDNENSITLYDIHQPKPVEDMPYIFCSRCNNRVVANSNFCSSCGNQISR